MARSVWLLPLLIFLAGCPNLSRFPEEANLPTASPSPRPSPLISPPAAQTKVEDLKHLPYALPPGPNAVFFLYHLEEGNIFLYPGAGKGLRNISELEPDRFVFDREGSIFLYDPAKELLCTFPEAHGAGRFAFMPSFDEHENLFFLATDDPGRFLRNIGEVAILPKKENGAPCLLQVLNLVGLQHGGINSFSITTKGDFLVFATEDGGIYLCSLKEKVVLSVCLLLQRPSASGIALDPVWGRYIAWEEGSEIFLFDRFEACLRPILWHASDPQFSGDDPYHLFFLSEAEEQVRSYDVRSREIRQLTLMNMAARDLAALASF